VSADRQNWLPAASVRTGVGAPRAARVVASAITAVISIGYGPRASRAAAVLDRRGAAPKT